MSNESFPPSYPTTDESDSLVISKRDSTVPSLTLLQSQLQTERWRPITLTTATDVLAAAEP